MIKKRLTKKIWYGSDMDSEGNPIVPPLAEADGDQEGLHHGELYLHIADDKLSLWTRTLTDQVKQIGGGGEGDDLWKLMETESGEKYIFSAYDVVTQKGITMYADGGLLDLPSIYDGLPLDNSTIYWEDIKDDEGNVTGKVLKARGTSEDGTISATMLGDLTNVGEWANALATEDRMMVQKEGNASWEALSLSEIRAWSNIEDKPAWITDEKPEYSFSEIGSMPSTLAGYGITDSYTKSEIDEVFFKKDEASELFVTLDETEQEILGNKNFIGNLMVNGMPIVYKDGYWKLEGDLLVTGGIASYSNDMEFSKSTIMDGVVCDEATISSDGGYLHFIGEIGGGISDVTSSGDGNAVTSLVPSSDGKTVTYVKGKTFAEKTYVDETFVSKTYVDDNFVAIGGDSVQEITGAKNFTGGLQVNGMPIVYKDGYWKLEGDLLVTGGIASYSNDIDYDPTSIMDAIVCDEQTITVKEVNGVKTLTVISGGTSSGGSSVEFNTDDFSVSGNVVSLSGARVKIVSASDDMSETGTLYVVV